MHLVFLMNWGSFMLGNIVSVRFHSSLATKMDAAERYRYNPKLEWNPRVKEYFIKAYGEQHFQCICDALTLLFLSLSLGSFTFLTNGIEA
ncbi:hypothetical protein AMTR_s00014p00017240 [Amborella trichopoda]|uniref:Uncharacterized protein n=1 Tax=Amborella trichopoda TaxID=13333 RepID=W1PLY8_AMBTC|nr:hypothetical protein AMTR_s00014p00017240 [Amborella trichopoda]